MKQLFLVVTFFFSWQFFYGQNKDSLINRYDSKGHKTGKWVEYDYIDGDTIKSVSNYSLGLLNGKSTAYYSNGQIEGEIFFLKGKKQGKSKLYYKSGVISHIFLFEKDKTIYHIQFDPQGRIFQESENGGMIQYYNGIPRKE